MPAGRDDRSHWGSVYADRAIDEVSWYQAEPTVSLELIGKAGVDPAPRSSTLVVVPRSWPRGW
jgi:hypothetical protein